jgi:hypothetical protein
MREMLQDEATGVNRLQASPSPIKATHPDD